MTADDRGGLRVTHIVFSLNQGGLERFVLEMGKRLDGSAVAMSVLSLSGREGRFGAQLRPYVEQYHVMRPVPLISMIAPVGLAWRVRRTRPDVVHLHSGAWYKGAAAARLARVGSVVYTEHGLLPGDHPWGGRVRRLAAAMTDVIVTVSNGLRQQLAAELGVGEGRFVTIDNGVDLATFSPGARDEAVLAGLRVPPGATVIGTVGSLQPIKAHDVLIRAFARARARLSAARDPYLVICGQGPERDALEALARELGVAERTRLAGWVDETVAYYRLFDVFVLPSLTEGAPLSLLEAMACGAAPLVTAVGANADILGPSLADQLVAPGDVGALADALVRLVGSDEHRGRIGGEARRRVEERYDLALTIDRYCELYYEIRARGRVSGTGQTGSRDAASPTPVRAG